MGSIVVYAIVTLWLTVMLLAVAAPLFLDRPGRGADVTPHPASIRLRPQPSSTQRGKTPVDRSAA